MEIMEMGHFNILHLSDLHIKADEDRRYEDLRLRLISDIKDIVLNRRIEIDAVAITGDIVDRGGKQEDYIKAQVFFEKLIKELNIDFNSLLFVPGNHDLPRSRVYSGLLESLNTTEYDEKVFREYWKHLWVRHELFNQFVFNLTGNHYSEEEMFGGSIRDITIKDQHIVRFVLFNSAWSSKDKNDFENLKIGREQIDKLISQERDMPQADLICGLMHHPLDWFEIEEKQQLNYFFQSTSSPIYLLLHGHIHKACVKTEATPSSIISYLVSGIGYPDSEDRIAGAPKLSDCRYSLYSINLEERICSVMPRISNKDGLFSPDTQLYPQSVLNGEFNINYASRIFFVTEDSQNTFTLKELDPIPTVAQNSWVGRDDEIKELLKTDCRVAAITGMGGQGKSALAAEIIHRHVEGEIDRFQSGIWADCREMPSTLHDKMIQVLETLTDGKESASLYREEEPESTANRLLTHLKNRKTLLILDNIDAYIDENSPIPINELRVFIDIILNNSHGSTMLLTSRNPVNDSRATFTHIPLQGLTPDEGVEFFKKRDILLEKNNNVTYCKQITRITNGHPWWLGLIAGQVKAGNDTLRDCITRFPREDATPEGLIKDYFMNIWNKLNSGIQTLLRYIVEAPMPLSQQDIELVLWDDMGPVKASKILRQTAKLGLLIKHNTVEGYDKYQVHPLVRQFVHDNYSVEAQRPLAIEVLKLFLPTNMVIFLFKTKDTKEIKDYKPQDGNTLSSSIETCINSRNYHEALILLELYGKYLLEEGYTHKYISFGCRVLSELDWIFCGILKRSIGLELVFKVIDKLRLIGDIELSDLYLKRFEKVIKPTREAEFVYYMLHAHCAWFDEQYHDAVYYIEKCTTIGIAESWKIEFLNLKGLILRDSEEDVDAAQKIFEDQVESHERFGNMARCCYKKGLYSQAEENLRNSLMLLYQESSHDAYVNKGYAYQWIAELLISQKDDRRALAFIELAKTTWSEHAPGLLKRLNKTSEKLLRGPKKPSRSISIKEAKKIEYEFLYGRVKSNIS